jgi:hypothetical protein
VAKLTDEEKRKKGREAAQKRREESREDYNQYHRNYRAKNTKKILKIQIKSLQKRYESLD